tara:strand:- start:687 stop:812 length:126 start_codon:yes stop_codon:yes gene_type:complete
MMLPQKNGSTGVASLRIIEVLKKVRKLDNIFELMKSEEEKI